MLVQRCCPTCRKRYFSAPIPTPARTSPGCLRASRTKPQRSRARPFPALRRANELTRSKASLRACVVEDQYRSENANPDPEKLWKTERLAKHGGPEDRSRHHAKHHEGGAGRRQRQPVQRQEIQQHAGDI